MLFELHCGLQKLYHLVLPILTRPIAGNCLYYSLSDQLYGDTHHADEIRQLLANHMASNKDYFMQFVVAEGGERRRPKRAAASAYATRSADVSAPSQQDMERRFQEMIATTRKNGEWGSSEHLQAFCQAFKVDLNVYTMDGVSVFQDVNALPTQPRDVLHVAFHVSVLLPCISWSLTNDHRILNTTLQCGISRASMKDYLPSSRLFNLSRRRGG